RHRPTGDFPNTPPGQSDPDYSILPNSRRNAINEGLQVDYEYNKILQQPTTSPAARMRGVTPYSMATVLSRALKLPGKKSHDPREYDPLTQADSDESEDDLVINIQQNGVQNGKGNRGSSQDRDSDVEGISKRVQQRPVDSKQDGLSNAGSLDPELKPPSSLISYVRTTVFLLTVVVSMVMVLICAFLIPCPMNSQHNMWTLHVGYDTEFSSPLELFDVDQDGVPDILLTFLSSRINASQGVVKQRPFLSVLSGVSGSILWRRHTQENLRSIQCGQLVIKQNDTCLLTGTYKLLSLITASTGESLWTMSLNHVSSGTIAAPAVILPDLDDDFINDLLVLTIGESQPDLGFLLISGRTGNPLGAIVKYSIMGEGKLLGPQAYYTSQGAIYILFGFGNIQAFALRDIYAQAKTGGNFPSPLQRIDPDWEKKRSVNHSKLINVYSAGVEFLQTVPVYLSNFSDLLVTTKDAIALVSGQDLEQRWSINLNNVYSHPKLGYFNSDGNLDFFIQIQSNTTEKKVSETPRNDHIQVLLKKLAYSVKFHYFTIIFIIHQLKFVKSFIVLILMILAYNS
ncbi:unnamed protein product, partial [Ranitomeya imitator]